MEENNSINSCLMLAIGLYTPVELGSIFDSADYKGMGLELDSHITLLYAQGKVLPKEEIIEDLKTLVNWEMFNELISGVANLKVFDCFELSSFENDSDYLVLKMKSDTDTYKKFKLINLSLRKKYNVSSEFTDYTPHITLAELQPGTASKYLESDCLKKVLNNSLVDFEDLILSYGVSSEVTDRKQHFLTNHKSVDRYFRLKNLRKNNKELE